MSEDSSSDDEWCASTKRKCWECGKKFSNIKSLMSHYKSHNIKATCHICNVTFRRLTSLSSHLDNAHSPPLCKKCHQSFSNVWELNKHAETHCIGSVHEASSLIPAVINLSQNGHNFCNQETAQQSTNSESRPQQSPEMKPETSENSVEYIVGEDDEDIDMESDCEKEDDSTSSESDDETSSKAGDGDSNSDSTDYSSDSSHNPHSKNSTAVRPSANSSICTACGRGPFRSMKLHLLHCSGVKVKYQCSRCKELFLTETSLNEHYMPLYTCDVCGQVFSLENLYHDHQCPKGSKSPLVLFCSESMPQACNICKFFFTSEETLLNHVTKVHMSVVSTKVCIITNPSALTKKNVSQGVHGTAAQSAIISSNIANHVINGKLCVGQTYAGSLSTIVKSSASLSTNSSHPGRPSAPACLTSVSTPVRSEKDGALGQPTGEPLNCLSSQASAVSDPVSPPMPTIMAMFENGSHDVDLMKRMNTGWRSKAPYPCRQCGAIFRQPSLIISHRYLHRGRRSHQCQCGRAFKHRLHLLRHCVQHAETVSYICVSCGETFTGAKLLAKHIKGKSGKKPRPGHKWKLKVKRECRMPFTCDCGQLFFRPSAYIWHQLRNRTKTKQLKSS